MSVAIDILAELRRHHVDVKPDGDSLRMRAPAAPPPALVEKVRRHKRDLLALLAKPAPGPEAAHVRPMAQFRVTPPILGQPASGGPARVWRN